MDYAAELALLKLDLDMLDCPEEREEQLQLKLDAARESIQSAGVALRDRSEDDGNRQDGNLVVMYAAWLYRSRAETDSKMPDMLRYALNQRIIAERADTADGT